MRISRIDPQGKPTLAFYDERGVAPVPAVADAFAKATGQSLRLPATHNPLELLPPDGLGNNNAIRLHDWLRSFPGADELWIPHDRVRLLTPIPRPNKLFLLAGNYAEHIAEGGEIAAERRETFPYVFMKPPSTTLTHPGDAVRIPRVSPDAIDWELELAVVIGRGGKSIPENRALDHVAGYTIINDISNRKFRPNPQRKERPRDKFFDWLHGKWHDSFCPCGPCIVSAHDVRDPQRLRMELRVNGEVKQSSSTSQQIFPVAAVIEFVSNIVTLEPGDIISTGTPAGVGNTTGQYLKPGDRMEGLIEGVGVLASRVVAE